MYPPWDFRHRSQEPVPEAFSDAEFYQMALGCALYVVEDPEDRDFGWAGWDLPQLGEGQQELALEAVLELVAPPDRVHVVRRTLECVAYADEQAGEHRQPERVRAIAAYYRRVLAAYAEGGLEAWDEAPLRPPVGRE